MIVSIGDFTGKYELHTGIYDVNKLQAYIDKYEPKYLRELFGITLYNEFISDLTLVNNQYVPQSPNFIFLFDPFAEDVYLYRMLISDGIKEMLCGFIYFEYVKDMMNTMTPFGNTISRSELSRQTTTLNTLMYNRYNEAIKTFTAIRDYIFLHWNDFPLGQIVGVNLLYTAPSYSNNTTQQIFVANGWVTQLSMPNLGTGYAVNQQINLGTNGLQVEVTQVDPQGVILDFIIIRQGYGHSVGQLFTLVGGQEFEVTQIANSQGTLIDDAFITTEALTVGGIQAITLTNFGTGYVDADNVPLVYFGTGYNGQVDIQADPNTGQVLQATISTPNTSAGYLLNDVLTIDQTGANFDATVGVTAVSNGELVDITLLPSVAQNSVNFVVGDRIHVQGNGNTFNAVFEVTQVGIGDITTYNGREKLMAYWI